MMRLLRGFLKFLNKALRHKEPEPTVETLDRRVEGRSAPISRPRRPIRIQVGLDFGTSCTKIAYSQQGRRLTRAVTFDHDLEIYPHFCLPSLGAIDDHGKLLLGVEAAHFLSDEPWDSGLKRFKVVVAGRYDAAFRDDLTEEAFYRYIEQRLGTRDALLPEQVTAVYLAYAMRQARQAVQSAPEYRNADLDLEFYVCMPIDHMENNCVCPVFQKILAWAEVIEKEWRSRGDVFDPLEFSRRVENEVNYGSDGSQHFRRIDQEARVFAVPEAVAEAASYLSSLQRQEGLHAIIDLGAGTIDVSIFNLVNENQNLRPYWYAAGNIPIGMNNIERIIATRLAENTSLCTARDVIYSLQQLVSEDPRIQNSELSLQMIETEILRELWEMHRKTFSVWGSAYRHLQQETPWRNVQVFISGGGAGIPHVGRVFSTPRWLHFNELYTIHPLPIPDPEDYPSNNNAPFQRMAVAYGLAQSNPEWGDYKLPADCPDHTSPPLPIRRPADRWDGSGINPTPGWLGR